MRMHAVIIDDDRPAIEELEDALVEAGLIGRVEGYTRVAEAMEHIMRERPDLVLLDIQMPGVHGLDIAEELRRVAPECAIVFVTAYAQHAVEAFKLEATDYLLKPVEPGRLQQTLRRIWANKRPAAPSSGVPSSIRLLGTMNVAGPAGQVKWRTNKSGELLAYLYLHREVAQERVIDDLFMGGKVDNTKSYLHTTIYQLRKSLAAAGLAEQLVISHGKRSYRLECIDVVSDIERFEQLVSSPASGREALHEAVNLYTGDLLEGVGSLWVLERREQFRRLFHETAGKLAVRLEGEGSTRQALEIIQKQHRHDPLNEALALEAARLYIVLRQHRLADDYIERFLLHYDKELGGDGERVLEQYRSMLG